MRISKRFFGVLTCFFLLFFTPIKHDSLAACGADPNADSVKIAGHAYTSTSIQDAYNYASTTLSLPSFTLQLAGEIFTEDLLLNGGAVVLDGGWDCTFTSKASPSRVLGTITINNGSLNVTAGTDPPRVVSSAQCAFDLDGDGFTSIGSCSGTADDCDDSNPDVYPGAVELCDGLDNDCNGQVDDGTTPVDVDNDGYSAIGSCGTSDDCNDNNAGINPGAEEIPFDGVDQDCSGSDLTFAGESCVGCHAPASNWNNLHDLTTPPDATCASCHATHVNNILSGHYGDTVRTTGNNVAAGQPIVCESCHDADAANHTGGIALGTGTNFVGSKISADFPNITCDTCHNGLSPHDTVTVHNNRLIDSTCGNCHTSDNSVLGSPGTGTLASAADVDALHGVVSYTDCVICHNYGGTLLNKAVVLNTIQLGLDGTQVSCLNCHTDKGVGHGNFEHPIEVGPNDLSYNPGQLCSDCHVVANWAEIESVEHNVDTNGAGSCATCHNSPRQVVQNIIADAPSNGGYPIRCLACHADKELVAHGSVDHVAATYVTRGTSFCLDCHDPGTAANATVDITHNGTCSLCHTTIPALQPGVPAGGGDCLDCHIDYPTPGTNDWYSLHVTNPPDHSALVTTTGTDNCASCHENQLVGSTSTTHLENCSNCHNASDGSLKSLAIGQTFIPGGNCETCHTDGWETTHFDNNNTTTTHNTLVRVDATSCSDCHSDPPLLTDNADAKVHSACGNCHNANGSRKTLYDTNLQSFVVGGDCTTCHGVNYFDSHTHTHDVSYNPLVDTSQTTQQGCATCHNDSAGNLATFADIVTEHGTCSRCHDYTDDGNGTPPQLTVESTIASGTGVTCATCHTPKVPDVDHGVDHIGSAYVTGEAACLVCHTDPATTFTDPANAKIHDDCTTCHDVGTNALVGSAIGNEGGPNTCTTCHTGRDWTDHDIDHATDGYVTLHSECTSCHAATLTAGAGFINPADDEKHNACTSCHAANGAISVTVNDCSECHSGETGDWTTHAQDHTLQVTQQTECSSCHSATVDYAAFVDPANDVKHDNCYVCHDNTTKLASATAGDCSQCHTANYFDSHTHTHDVSYNPLVDTSQTTQQGCATCHNDSAGNLATFADIVTEHGTCSRCHDYTDDGNGTPPQLTVESTIASGTGVTCATCHTPKVPDVDHGVDHIGSAYVTGEAACLVCHTDPATTFTDPANAKIHDDCTTCHDVGTNALVGSAIGNEGGPNTCTTCHTGRDWTDHDIDHATDGYVTLHSECTSCHAATLTAGAGFINPADDEKHNACTSCHAANGAISVTVNDCSECHSGETGDWTTHAQDHTLQVTQQTECSSCHSATVDYAAFVDPANDVKHDNCYVCHDNTTKLASATAGDCSQCHTANYFDSHTHTHDVSYNPLVDTSQTTQQGCATCHNDSAGNLATFADIVTEHGTCSRCHDYTDDGNGTPPQLTVESTIASGTGVTCATCHTPKVPDVDHGVDHIGSAYVTGEAACLVCHTDPATTFTDPANAKIHDDCTTCHDVGTNALVGSAIGNEGGPNTCTTCHTGRDWTDHDIDHATDGYVTLHSECTSCHAATLTAGAGFINPADDEKHNACTSCHAANGAISVTVNDCSECHSGETGDWTTHAQDHTLQVTQQTECSSCHSATVDYAAFVDPANDVKHDNCYVCHDNTTKLASAAAGDCSQCHSAVTGDFSTHTSQDHTTKVISATGCTSCHSATVDYAAFVDPANNFKHDSCATCHDATTNAPVATAGDCSQCHSGVTGDFSTHITQDHTTKVTLQTECNNCHTETVDYANFIDAANDKKHDACSSCHNATTNAPVATAGDCSQCHTANYFDSHMHSHTVSVGGDQSNGQLCSECHVVSTWAEIEGTEHNVATNGAGSCATCHNSPTQTVIDVIAAGAATTCLDCHTDKTVAHGSIDHVAATYVTVGGTGLYYDSVVEYEDCSTAGNCKTCADCHDPGGAANATVDVTHSGDCALCHTTVPNLQPGVPTGGGDCVTCHTPSQHTLWTRYMDTCSRQNGGQYGQPGIACHPGFNNGPGNSFHDAHNPAGGWADRNSATSGLTYPFASNPEMWIPNWPLNPTCNTCHTAPDDDTSGAGCGACHNFPSKGDLHDVHAGKKAGQQDINCSNCHWNS